MDVQIDTKKAHNVQQTRQKMSKEERAHKRRNDHIAREKDRERKRAKRMNVAYRQIEQERDRERKKMLRSDTAFRTLEKIRDRLRKERKKFGLDSNKRKNLTKDVNESLVIEKQANIYKPTGGDPDMVLSGGEVRLDEKLLEPEVILSTNEYNSSHNSYNQLPQQYNNNFSYEHPHHNQF